MIKSSQKSISIDLYPNPSNGEFNLKINDGNAGDVLVEIFTTQGVLINTLNFTKPKGEFIKKLDLSGFAKEFI